MSTIEANRTIAPRRAPRLWIVETLIVLGILGFGYFAVTMDTVEVTADPGAPHPLAELIR